MIRISYFVVVVILFSAGLSVADDDQGQGNEIYDSHSFERTVIKNRDRINKTTGAYNETAQYVYCDDKEIQKQLKEQENNGSDSVDLCTARVDGSNRQKKVRVAIDTNRDVVVKDGRDLNIGTVDVDTRNGGGRGQDIGTYVNTGDITVKGRYGR